MSISNYKETLGNVSWKFLHQLSYGYNPQNRNDVNKFRYFLDIFADIYPCEKCKNHMKDYFRRNPFNETNTINCIGYLCKFHNEVNKRLGKPIYNCRRLLS